MASTLTTIAVLAVVFVFGLPILGTYAGGAIEENQQAIDDKKDAKDFGNNPAPGKIICDLYLRVFGELDRAGSRSGGFQWPISFGESLVVFMGTGTSHPEIAQYEWVANSCYTQGGNSFIPLIAYNFAVGEPGLLSVLTFGDTFTLEMTGYSKNGNGLLTEKGTIKVWTEEVKIEDFEFVTLPLSWSEEFFLQQVVVDDYTLELRAIDQSINEDDTNKPITYDIIAPNFRD